MTPKYDTRNTLTYLIPKEKLNSEKLSAESNDKSCFDQNFIIASQPWLVVKPIFYRVLFESAANFIGFRSAAIHNECGMLGCLIFCSTLRMYNISIFLP